MRYSHVSLGFGHVGATLDTQIAIFSCENPLFEVWGFVGLSMILVSLLMGFVDLFMGFVVLLMIKKN
jgi:hypothetical protein